MSQLTGEKKIDYMEYLGILRYNVDASTFTVVTSPRIIRGAAGVLLLRFCA